MTREDVAIIVGNTPIDKGDNCYTIAEYQQAKAMAIKALTQVEVLDKIRAEIEALPKTYPFINHIDTYVKEDDVKKIIDKYMTESENN